MKSCGLALYCQSLKWTCIFGLSFSFEDAVARFLCYTEYKSNPFRQYSQFGLCTFLSMLFWWSLWLGAAFTWAACSNPRVRREWSSLGQGTKQSYIAAVQCTQTRLGPITPFAGSRSRFDDFTALHVKEFQDVHWVAQFLPWHRYYLWLYESVLIQECGYQGALPYWDEVKDAGFYAQSDLFQPSSFGGDGDPSRGWCISTGPFAATTLHIGQGDIVQDHCLTRRFDPSASSQTTPEIIEDCLSRALYADFWVCTEWNPHVFGHAGVGGEMYTGKSSSNGGVRSSVYASSCIHRQTMV
ncbi:hypothetical protein DL96DRAFT_1012081 [Flagelloscypha sp. PMI_526]|nr:hypothetical protein DL96DRAFT_1012081 [Flagelloscypha sp. PMI_526]